MKHLLLSLFLLVTATPLFANDEGGDGAYIPNYQELVREGYGPQTFEHQEYLRLAVPVHSIPKPTQAFYGKGYTVYYGFTAVSRYEWNATTLYAFGYPVDYFRHLMPDSITDTDLNHYAVVTPNYNGYYGPGYYMTQGWSNRANAVTTVQKTTIPTSNGSAPLPAIGEKTH